MFFWLFHYTNSKHYSLIFVTIYKAQETFYYRLDLIISHNRPKLSQDVVCPSVII